MKEAGLDIVVVNYKSSADLDRFLTSVDDCAPNRPHQVWIAQVEPGEADTLVGVKWRHTMDKQWREATFEENIGYNRACNAMGLAGSHELIAFFNADVVLKPGALDIVCDELMARDDWGIAGPRQMNERGQLVAGGIFGTDVKPQHRGWKATQGYQDTRDDCTVVCGSALFIKRSVWDELAECEIHRKVFPEAEGPWLPLHHFYGDTGLSYHARGHGYLLGFVGSTTITHKLHGAARSSPWSKADKADFRAFCAAHGLECE